MRRFYPKARPKVGARFMASRNVFLSFRNCPNSKAHLDHPGPSRPGASFVEFCQSPDQQSPLPNPSAKNPVCHRRGCGQGRDHRGAGVEGPSDRVDHRSGRTGVRSNSGGPFIRPISRYHRRVFKHLGQEVKAGDVLALVDAAEVGKAKADLLQAMASYQVKLQTASSLRESGAVVPAARLREADAAVIEASITISSACQSLSNLGLPVKAGDISPMTLNQLETHLQFLGIPPATVAQLSGVQTNCLLPLVAPLDGKILSREVVAGEVVDTARILFEVVDTRSSG